MIAMLKGTVVVREEDRAIVEVAGVGYEVFLPVPAAAALRADGAVTLWTIEVGKEDGRELFGFPSQDGRDFFRRLIGVSGVGPRTALHVMSIGSPDDVRAAVDAGDVARLTSIPGIGAKTAQKIILELRGKLALAASPQDDDVLEALAGLGYARQDAAKALAALPAEIAGEEARLKEALKLLGKKR